MSPRVGDLLGAGKGPEPEPVLLSVTPPRMGERTLLGVENLLASIAVPEPFSLEIAADSDGAALMARCADGDTVRGQLAVRYPQARIEQLGPADDPLRLGEGERAWSMTLRASGPEHAPLRRFRDDDLLDAGSDPMMALIGAVAELHPGERVVSRLLLSSLGPDWARGRAAAKASEAPGPGAEGREGPGAGGAIGLAALGAVGIGAMQAYRWVQDGEVWRAAALGAGALLAVCLAGWGWARWNAGRGRPCDPEEAAEKLSRMAFEAEVVVTAIMPDADRRVRARDLLGKVAAAYRNYDNPAGARFICSAVREGAPDARLRPAPPGLLGARSVLGARDAAALWHPPGAADDTPLVERSGARVLAPAARAVSGGALVGSTAAGIPRQVRFPQDLLRRHHLYVARTRMGKSTLMAHIAAHKMREKAAGRDPDAVVVVDPHADLAEDLLSRVPAELAGSVRLVDLADADRAPGINLLDARIFSDRDRTADSVVRVARGLWDQWGPRMQSILEHSVKSLHEANSHMEPDRQYTILDALPLLSDSGFRTEVLGRVSDPYLLEWWSRDFGSWHAQYRADALAPVQTRISYYASSRRARAILGQRRSTIDLRRTILEGGVLLVSAAQGSAGRDVAALVGASLLNLVDSVMREQGALPPEERRGALVVVDEMQTMPGVDYEAMLSELGKFGASIVLATQSLAKLADLSPTMQDTVLANVGCLAVFQVSGADARRLVWELGSERVAPDDITSLPVHHCYVRATVGTERVPSFSMAVRPPDPPDPEAAARIRAAAARYSTPIPAPGREQDARVSELREQLSRVRQAESAPSKRRSRSRRAPAGGGGSGPAAGV